MVSGLKNVSDNHIRQQGGGSRKDKGSASTVYGHVMGIISLLCYN